MINEQIVWPTILIGVSVILFASSIVWWIRRTISGKRLPEKCNKAGVSTALVFSAFLILSIWMLRFAVGYFFIVTSVSETQQLTPLEEFVNSLFGTLRTFNMEEGYTDYIINIKFLVSSIVPESHWSFPFIKTVIITYASLLNLIAPIIGGAIILEILASVFPKIRLQYSYLKIRRTKYFFSELNSASLALAKSICVAKKDERPIIIFTDTYIDDEKEKEYELLLEAKQYGAICIRDDLEHVSKPKLGKREYYLMDENELGNLQTLMGLAEGSNIKFIKDSQIFLFVQSDAYVQVEKQINIKFNRYVEELNKKHKRRFFKSEQGPTIIPIHSYRNLVHNLFVEIPLYEPLINKKDNAKLNLTIFGNGIIGTEAFLSAYWFGQMLICHDGNGKKAISECELTINIVSKDSEEVFWSKIDYINSEIKETVEVLGNNSECNNKGLLNFDSDGHKNSPYCRVKYIKADVKIDGFWDYNSQDSQDILDSDYFIVALGNDADNISVSDKLRLLIGKKHLEEATDEISGNVIIAYAVFNSKLAKTLNEQKKYQCRVKEQTDIFMHAFGSLEQVYSYDNVNMSKYKLLAETIGAAYDNLQLHQKLLEDNNERKDDENNNYNYWANLARAMHIKYKVFSLGLINKSIFDCDYNVSEHVKEQCKKYMQVALAEAPQDFCDEMERIFNDIQSKKHLLAWVEHRRWNAFTRTMGYQHTDVKKLFDVKNNKKDMELKLHSCLVEARCPRLTDDTYIHAEFMVNDKVDTNTFFVSFPVSKLDYLDEVSYECKERSPSESVNDLKMYDYYRYEFKDYQGVEVLAKLLK